jgi:hypothetical protein
MLYNGVNHFNWQVNNISDSYMGDTSSMLQLTSDGAAHTKGTDTAALVGIAHDCWGLAISITAGNTDATIRRQMTDILSWSVAVNNIFTNSPSSFGSTGQGHSFYFPLFLPAGTAIGARMQDVVGASTIRLGIRVLGQPTRPDLVKVGTKVQTIGATTASTSGVAVTPGSDAYGSYSASMGTLTNDAWWWQLGIGSNDSTMTANSYRFDIATDATAKYVAAAGISYGVQVGTEQSVKFAFGEYPPIWHAPAGTDVYVRGAAVGTPDGTMTTVVYAVT